LTHLGVCHRIGRVSPFGLFMVLNTMPCNLNKIATFIDAGGCVYLEDV